MKEQKGRGIKISDLFPEGFSVLRPIMQEIDRNKQPNKKLKSNTKQTTSDNGENNQSPQISK